MLEKIDLNRKMGKKEYKAYMDHLQPRLAYLQRGCKENQIPVIVVFEGLGAAGKGTLINQMIEPLDPRGFAVHATAVETGEETMHPFLWRFWTKLPERGRIAIFDRGWYRRVLTDRFDGTTAEEQLESAYDEICSFEKLLTDDGVVLIKLFTYIAKEEQKKRFDNLQSSKKTSWRVTKDDLKRNKHYDTYIQMNEDMLEKTDTDYAPWNIIEGTDREYAAVKMMQTVVDTMEYALLKKQKQADGTQESEEALPQEALRTSVLAGVNLDQEMDKAEYQDKIADLQERLSELHNQLYRYRIPVVLAFEGWDAAGKGGTIKRLTQALDPRGYVVNPIAAPNDIEREHHYLWRFWTKMPKAGHIAIFDRSWYGRVMVERIEGFCTEQEWKRAYHEMNEMEAELVTAGNIVIKFWLQIDKEEQGRRFQERQENPEKQWKITEEDWRNRAKWDEYEKAVDEMLVRTSTSYAPWVIVEANDKYSARIKVLETVIAAIEKRIDERK